MSQVALTIEPVLDRTPALTLHDWLQRDEAYGALQVEHGSVLTGVIGDGALAGLFRLLRTWLELQRGRARVHAEADGLEVDLELDGQMNPDRISSDIIGRLAPGHLSR
jgi:hypothetical protein